MKKVLTILFSFAIVLRAGIGVGTSQESPVPVELSSFNASVNEDAVVLNWTTATETNNYGFEIQRALINGNRSEFETIGFVQGSGNSNSPKNYSFVDENPINGDIAYRLKQIDNDGKYKYSSILELKFNLPQKFVLEQNYPNPFNPSTIIGYSIPKTSNVSLKIYDVLGRNVATLVNKVQEKGSYRVSFDASQLSAGVYYYRLEAGEFSSIKKMLLIK